MAVSLFSKHLTRKDLPAQGLARRNHMVIAHGLLGNCNNWNTSSDMLLKRDVGGLRPSPYASDGGKQYLPFVTDIYQVDMRNHGNSPHTPTHHSTQMASDLEAFVMTKPSINSTPNDRTIMVGHSMGGMATLHSLIRRANSDYYLNGLVPSTSDEVEIRDTLVDVDGDERNLNHYGFDPISGRKTEREFYGVPPPPTAAAASILPPRVNGAIIVDIPPMQINREGKLGSVRSIVHVMHGLDLTHIKTTREGDNALKSAGIADPHMRMFLMTNMAFDGHGADVKARWKCNIEALFNDLDQILIPDEDPADTMGMKKVSDVPVFFVFGSISEYYKSRARVEGLIDKYFDSSCVTIEVLEGCDHYPHYQAPKRYVEVVAPFISKVFS